MEELFSLWPTHAAIRFSPKRPPLSSGRRLLLRQLLLLCSAFLSLPEGRSSAVGVVECLTSTGKIVYNVI